METEKKGTKRDGKGLANDWWTDDDNNNNNNNNDNRKSGKQQTFVSVVHETITIEISVFYYHYYSLLFSQANTE